MEQLYQSLVAVEPFTLVVSILNLFLQLYLIKKFLLNKVTAVLLQRRELADRQIRETEQAKKEAEQLRQNYETQVFSLRQAADQMLQTAQKTAQEQADHLLAEARTQAAQVKEQAAADIAKTRKKVINDTKNEIADIAMAIAAKAVGRALDGQDQSRLVDGFIQKLGDEI